MNDLEFFSVNSNKYVPGTNYRITRPASLDNPKNNAVMFILAGYPEKKSVFDAVEQCLIFWPSHWELPSEASARNAFVPCANPRIAYCEFFKENHIDGLCPPDEIEFINGAWIAKTAKIGENTVVFPGCYIGGQVTIGKNCYIGAGAKIIGRCQIGNRTRIRENVVIGTDGFSTDRDEYGHPQTMPQFGGVVIEDDVQIGANSVIQRGAIDDTVLCRGCKVDGLIAHNVAIGEEAFVIRDSAVLGSASIGKQTQVSASCVVGTHVHVGSGVMLGMGSVVTRDLPDDCIAFGAPAKIIRKRFEG